MNLNPAVVKNFVFDWEMFFCRCEVYRFQNLVGLDLPTKHIPNDWEDVESLQTVKYPRVSPLIRSEFILSDCIANTASPTIRAA